LSYNQGGYSYTQTSWAYEVLNNFPNEGVVTMWSIGSQQAGGWTWVPTTQDTILRDGNWDWATQSQRWHGIGGTVGSGTPRAILDSLYLSAKPSFFGGNPWPWVDPSNGLVYTLPAKARFEAIISGGDTTPPSTTLTAPSAGATVSGTAVTVSANASDNVEVVGVQFKLDGVNLGAEDTSSPYTIIWDTTLASDGSHRLTAVARDAAGNSNTSAGITVTVNNTPPALPKRLRIVN